MSKTLKLASYFQRKIAQTAYELDYKPDYTFSMYLKDTGKINILDNLKNKISEEATIAKRDFERMYDKIEFLSKVFYGLGNDPIRAIEMLDNYPGVYFGDLDSLKEELLQLKEQFKNKE